MITLTVRESMKDMSAGRGSGYLLRVVLGSSWSFFDFCFCDARGGA